MSTGHRGRRALVAAAVVVVAAAGCAVDLGTLGGSASRASDINDAGVVVGSAQPAGSERMHAFRKRPGRPMEDLNGSFLWSAATGVNEAGVIVGAAATTDEDSRAVMWDADGDVHDLGVGSGSYASAINDGGVIVGTLGSEGFVLDPAVGTIELLPAPDSLPGFQSTNPTAINNEGAIVGSSIVYPGRRAVLWTPGDHELVELPHPILPGPTGGRRGSIAEDIADDGTIVGNSTPWPIAVLWTADTHEALNITPPGETYGLANAINDHGVVVGSNREHALRWVPGQPAEQLGTLGGSSDALAVNDVGTAAGVSTNRDGHERAVIFRTR